MFIDLNCDLGEGFGHDEEIMPFITSANIACGFHAGDERTMRETIRLAKKFGVKVGAHPGWNDRERFGRREMDISAGEIRTLVIEQIKRLESIAKDEGIALSHVKPHGALYNQAARDIEVAMAVAEAVKSVSVDLALFGLAGSRSIDAGAELGLKIMREGFPDRGYQIDESLIPRHFPNALIDLPDAVAQNAIRLAMNGRVDTLCLHGDQPHAVENARLVFEALKSLTGR